MALENTTAKYTIEVTQAGTGATDAVLQFQKVEAAAAKANTSLTGTTAATAQLTTHTKTATQSVKAFQGILTVAGLQTFPQLTAAAMLTKQTLDAMRISGTALSLNFATVTAGVVGLAAALISAAAAWGMYNAQKGEEASAKALAAQTEDIGNNLLNRLTAAREAGDLTNQTFRQLSTTLGTIAGNKQVIDFLKDLRLGSASGLMAEQQRGFANTRVQLENVDPNFATDAARQKIQLQSEYNDQVKLYNVLRADGLITEQQLTALTMEADTSRLNSLNQIRRQMTEIQQLGQSVAENFAGGFSQAFVAMVSGTMKAGEAFRQFATQFLQQTAQMIMQLAIMRVLFGATGASTGTGGLLGGLINKAAAGGMFPQMMAAGGMAGVSSVSNATYFPRFNVVAGEAGREMMTVLARPRMMEVGGMQAVVGSAQGNELAITSAAALAGRGGGMIVIQVQGTPDFEARVVSNSVKGAVVQVAQDMRQDTPISRGVKGLTG